MRLGKAVSRWRINCYVSGNVFERDFFFLCIQDGIYDDLLRSRILILTLFTILNIIRLDHICIISSHRV